ncbi:MAG: bifunctional DNA-formamidopyrimidine glycosylase/DNA-(apurinic or apyrimidinic site) lyase [Candidatus Taylorbacteria bacterium]|nr:bifunctional DNA-formamidopyrimidine glycosylase/DNA-(apurinic or apyrimidinic site) lyase [Candidatus Taylorbacteria bacterium]
MPELPEVQTTVNGLNASIRGLSILDVWTDYNSKFHTGKDSIKDPAYFKYFRKNVVGAKIIRIDRLAKNILIRIEKQSKKKVVKSVILVHLKMTGHLLYGKFIYDNKINKWTPGPNERASLSDPYNRFTHFVISLSNKKHVALSDARKFAKVTLIAEKDMAKTIHLAGIGPDPINKEFTFNLFKERLDRRPTGRIKQVLMDQTIIAGVGNIYSDEALWRADLHPETRVRNIPDQYLKKLYSALLAVLSKGINFGGDSMSDYRNIHGERGKFQEHHKVYQKKGEKCSKSGCKGTIIRKIVGGRSAHFCDIHQKLLTE